MTTTTSSSETTPLNGGTSSKPSAAVARSLYQGEDVEGSRKYHEAKSNASSGEEAHQSEGGFMKPIIFGGLDGILTSFAIVAGSAGGNLAPSVVLILGFSNIFADALSMGTFVICFLVFVLLSCVVSFLVLSFIYYCTVLLQNHHRSRRIFEQQGE